MEDSPFAKIEQNQNIEVKSEEKLYKNKDLSKQKSEYENLDFSKDDGQ